MNGRYIIAILNVSAVVKFLFNKCAVNFDGDNLERDFFSDLSVLVRQAIY